MSESRIAKLAAHLTGFGAKAGFRVAVLGASGGIGQPLSLLLKKTNLVRELHLYDVKGTKGVMADLSHINTYTTVRSFEGNAELAECLKVSRRKTPAAAAAAAAGWLARLGTNAREPSLSLWNRLCLSCVLF
mmetsp:Transcript_8082/g.23115  ORF Transcript_8082/g.23115 Transcript_8082/m.23115 type:complete len:132 (+) Transcript_8082:257-652(+)